MQKHKKNRSVLSVYPTPRGYAFVLWDSPLTPHDWGTKDFKKDVGSARCVESIRELLDEYRPDAFVVEDTSERQTKRSLRVKRILKAVGPTARRLSIEVVPVTRKDVRSAFAQFGAVTKQDIANVIARKIEAFAARIPRPRKTWQAQDPRMGVFDAASRALTYYYKGESGAD